MSGDDTSLTEWAPLTLYSRDMQMQPREAESPLVLDANRVPRQRRNEDQESRACWEETSLSINSHPCVGDTKKGRLWACQMV